MTNRQMSREKTYREVRLRLDALITSDTDWVAAMATVVCELHHSFEQFHWTGFYRVVAPQRLAVGPYQGTHGCLHISFDRGVCGAAARTGQIQRHDDVLQIDDHIACSSTTRSEIVVPVFSRQGVLLAVLDVDSDDQAAFDEVDERELSEICQWLGELYSQDE